MMAFEPQRKRAKTSTARIVQTTSVQPLKCKEPLLNNPDKVFFIEAYFDRMRARVDQLKKLDAGLLDGESFRDEALILCLVYIDGMASCYYGEKGTKTKENFCKALRELSGDPLFGKLHVPYLLSHEFDKHGAGAKPAVEALAASKPGQLLDETEVADAIPKSRVEKSDQQSLITNLWRYSVGAICYEVMRNAAVHGLGASPLSFGETLHAGAQGFELNFPVLHEALRSISEQVAKESIDKGEWFGRKNYLKSR